MKLTTSIILFTLSAFVQAECNIVGGFGTVPDTRCCWGGDQGSDACFRQTRSASCGAAGNFQEANFCRNKGIPSSKCKADCCDIATGRGQPCPKGKNRCDEVAGCPYRDFATGKLL